MTHQTEPVLPPLIGTLAMLPERHRMVIEAYGMACAAVAIQADRAKRIAAPVLTDGEIADAQGRAFHVLFDNGYNGGMGGLTWDRASARAIEAAVLDKLQEHACKQ